MTNNIKNMLSQIGFYTDWRLAGIPGGIPNATTIYGKPIPPGACQTSTAKAINEAIQAAGDDVAAMGEASPTNLRVVQLTEGIFDAGDNPIELNRPGVILRGMGTSTIIRGTTGNAGAITIGREGAYSITTKAIDLIQDAHTGSDRITIADASIFFPGQILKLDRYANDATAAEGGTEWPNGHNQFMRRADNSEFGPASEAERPVAQYIEVASTEGNTLILSNRININFPLVGTSGKKLHPQVWDTGAHNYKYIGLENIKLQMTSPNDNRTQWAWNTPGVNVRTASSYSWVKNVESDGTFFHPQTNRGFMARHVELNGYRNHVTGGHFHHSSQIGPGGNGYGVRWHGTDCVIDNNICDMLNKPLIGQTTNGGNVIAYNYIPNAPITPHVNGEYPDAATPGNPQPISDWNETALDTSHGGYSHSDLHEGNYTANIHTDSTSTNGWIVLFRNHSFGRSVMGLTTGSINGVAIDGPQGEHASIGNVYLNPETGKNAAVWDKPGDENKQGIAVYRFNTHAGRGNGKFDDAMGSGLTNPDANRNWAYERFYWAYDYNYAKNEIEPARATPIGSNLLPTEIPNSLHFSSAPDYFSGYVWPPVNPFGETDDERIGKLPAKDRFDA